MHTDLRLLDPTFLLEHDARLRALARRLVHDAGLADDVAQDVWLRALRGSHRVETRISGWLSGIARHVAFGRNRERAARSRRELATPPPSPTPSAEDLAAREAARRAVVAAVMRLPDAARDVVVLRFFDDLSSREISKRVGAPIETVRTRIKRALEQLRRDLDREYGGDGRSWCVALAPILAVPKAAVSSLAVVSLAAIVLLLVGFAVSPAFEEPSLESIAASSESEANAQDPNPTSERAAPADPNGASSPIVVPEESERSAIVDAATADVSDVDGRVLDVFDRPIADARVTLRVKDRRGPDRPKLEVGSTATDADGRFMFRAAPLLGSTADDVFRDEITVEHHDFPTLDTQLAARQGSKVTLRGLVRLRGTVRDERSGQPIGSGTIDASTKGVFGTGKKIGTAVLGADGTYALEVQQDSELFLVATRAGMPRSFFETRVGREAEHVFDLVLPSTRPLTIEVVTLASRSPLAGVEILSNGPGLAREVVGTTSERGRFESAGVPADGWSAILRVPDRELEAWFTIQPPDATASGDPIRFRIPEPWSVRGRIVDADGAPVVGIAIAPRRPPAIDPLDAETFARTTGIDLAPVSGLLCRANVRVLLRDDGSFELVDPVPGRPNRTFFVKRPGEHRARHGLPTFEAPMPGATYDLGTVVIDMTTASVSLRVRDAEKTLPGSTVVGEHGGETRTWTVGDHGYLEVDELPAGAWTFTATSERNGTSEPRSLTLEPDTAHSVIFDFAGSEDELVTTRGIVLLSDGQRANRFNGHVFAMQGDQRINVRTLDDGSFEAKTSKNATEPLRFAFANTFPICVATAKPGANDVELRHPHLVPFRLRFVDADGAPWRKPVHFDWKDDGTFRPVPNESGKTPRSGGILEFLWPEGAVTLRVRGEANLDADGEIVDVDVRANDDASAPCIVVR